MQLAEARPRLCRHAWPLSLLLGLFVAGCGHGAQNSETSPHISGDAPATPCAPVSTAEAQQVVAKYCVSCHSPNGAASDYDWSNERSLMAHRRNVAAKLAQGSMPPPGVKQPDSSERRTLWCWAKD